MRTRSRAGLLGVQDSRAARVAVLALVGAVTRADIPGLCARLSDRLDVSAVVVVVCDVGALVGPDVAALDALARLELIARRRGARLALHRASAELLELVALAGLSRAMPACDATLHGCGLVDELGREPEGGEQRGVEEVRDATDPAV